MDKTKLKSFAGQFILTVAAVFVASWLYEKYGPKATVMAPATTQS